MTKLNVKTVSASVKQQHYDIMFASMEQRQMISKIIKHGMLIECSYHTSNHVIGASPKEALIN